MKNALYITPIYPDPSYHGGSKRSWFLLSALSKRYAVTVLSPPSILSDRNAQTLDGKFYPLQSSRETISVDPPSGMWNKLIYTLKDIFNPFPDEAEIDDRLMLEAGLAGLGKPLEDYDIVLIKNIGMVKRVHRYLDRSIIKKTKLILDLDDIHTQLYLNKQIPKEQIYSHTGRLWRVWAFLNYLKLKMFYRTCGRIFDKLLVCSEGDRLVVDRILGLASPSNKVVVCPNVVANDFFNTRADLERPPRAFLYVGAMMYRPNIDAVHFFSEKILPLIKAELPTIRFNVVGNLGDDCENLKRYEDAQTHIVGYVEDVKPYMAQATAMVVPLRWGGGTRIKILEAMAQRLPVISTTLGAEGLGLEPDKHILIADTPEEFARQCVRLAEDPALQRSLADNAHDFVRAHYHEDIVKENVTQQMGL